MSATEESRLTEDVPPGAGTLMTTTPAAGSTSESVAQELSHRIRRASQAGGGVGPPALGAPVLSERTFVPGSNPPASPSMRDFLTDGSVPALCDELARLTGVPIWLKDR